MQGEQDGIIERSLALSRKIESITMGAMKAMLDVVVYAFQQRGVATCSFYDLAYNGYLYLQILHDHHVPLENRQFPIYHFTEMVLSAAEEAMKSCRKCLTDMIFSPSQIDLENDNNLRPGFFELVQHIQTFGFSKEDILCESDSAVTQQALDGLEPVLIAYFYPGMLETIEEIARVDGRNPSLALLVAYQGYIGYIIGIAALIQRKTLREFLDHLGDRIRCCYDEKPVPTLPEYFGLIERPPLRLV